MQSQDTIRQDRIRQNTIIALATPPGRSGVAVLRISGPAAKDALAALGVPLPAPRVATLASLLCPEEIDRALVLWFPAPASFTGEDVVELHVHGSRAVISALLSYVIGMGGIRLAQPGEFSRRAFLHGKMDLTQAEGLADLIDAETASQRRQALSALSGHAGKHFEMLRAQVLTALARLEAWIDFPDEEIPTQTWVLAMQNIQELCQSIEALLADSKRGVRIREGVNIVILGAPNAGKSSLMNALAKREVAIVSHIAGTTRDVIETHLDIGGVAAILVDTAGIQESKDPIEKEGIRRAKARAASADVKLICVDSASPAKEDVQAMVDDHSILVFTKADIGMQIPAGGIAVSAHTGQGIDAVVSALQKRLSGLAGGEPPLITRARHSEALRGALGHLTSISQTLPMELICEELRRAAEEIGKITGKIVPDEVLGRIFSEFCIGK